MKKQNDIFYITLLTFFIFISGLSRAANPEPVIKGKSGILTPNGAWCWFADPRAVYYKGAKEQTYFAWVSNQGDIIVASYNHQTGDYVENVVHEKLEIDDHDVPAIFVREDGRIVVFYSMHLIPGPMFRFISKNPEDITSFGPLYTWGDRICYPNPFQVGNEIHLFYRGLNWHPTRAVSTDNGVTFSDEKQLVLGGGDRPYARYAQSSDGSVHVAFTTGHPRNEEHNKIYYSRLKDNCFYRADGTLIKEFETGIDLDKNEAEVVYDGVTAGRGWIWDITTDPETSYPVMVYASFPMEDDHRYHYAHWNGTKWISHEIVHAGKWFPQTPEGKTEPETHYSGGIYLDHSDPSVVYLSKQVNAVFEIFKYKTFDKGETWEITPITENTSPGLVNVRPMVPLNHKKGYFDVLWMQGTYEYYNQKFNTSIMWYRE